MKTRRNIVRLQEKLHQLTCSWKELSLVGYPGIEESEEKDLLLQWFQLNLQMNGYEAALREVGVVCDEMGHLCEERRKMGDSLKMKISQIQQFRDVVVSKERESERKRELFFFHTFLCTYSVDK